MNTADMDIVSLGCDQFRADGSLIDLTIPKFTPLIDISELLRSLTLPNEELSTYQDIRGHAKLRELLQPADWPSAEVMITSGGTEALAVAIHCTAREGSEVVLPKPGFPLYEAQVRQTGATAVPYAVNGSGPQTPVDVLQAINARTSVVIVNSPHNPTGTILSHDLLQALASRTLEVGAWLIFDESHSTLCHSDSFVALPPGQDGGRANQIRINSLSKMLGVPGLRLGWLIASDPEVMRRIDWCRLHGYLAPSSISQRLAIAALTSDFSSALRGRNDDLRMAASSLTSACKHGRVGFVEPVAGPFVYLIEPANQSPLTESLARLGIAGLPAKCFGDDRNAVRLALPTTRSMLDRVCSSVASLKTNQRTNQS
jgi:aspartate/methionine/tyrosine aminotransferase